MFDSFNIYIGTKCILHSTGEKIDLISTLSTGIGIPLCLLATFLVDSRGTKKGIHVGASLTIIGKLRKFENTKF